MSCKLTRRLCFNSTELQGADEACSFVYYRKRLHANNKFLGSVVASYVRNSSKMVNNEEC